MANTKSMEVNGFVVTAEQLGSQTIVVRFTSDKAGETISFQAKDNMIAVAFEPIIELIDETRKARDSQ